MINRLFAELPAIVKKARIAQERGLAYAATLSNRPTAVAAVAAANTMFDAYYDASIADELESRADHSRITTRSDLKRSALKRKAAPLVEPKSPSNVEVEESSSYEDFFVPLTQPSRCAGDPATQPSSASSHTSTTALDRSRDLQRDVDQLIDESELMADALFGETESSHPFAPTQPTAHLSPPQPGVEVDHQPIEEQKEASPARKKARRAAPQCRKKARCVEDESEIDWEFESILARNPAREYLVRWSDGSETWEFAWVLFGDVKRDKDNEVIKDQPVDEVGENHPAIRRFHEQRVEEYDAQRAKDRADEYCVRHSLKRRPKVPPIYSAEQLGKMAEDDRFWSTEYFIFD
jgi:hypothetical protein